MAGLYTSGGKQFWRVRSPQCKAHVGPTKEQAAVPSKKSNHSQFVAALSSSLPGAGVTDSDAVVARLAAEGAGGGLTKEVCMAVRKSGIPVLLPLLYLVPGGAHWPGLSSCCTGFQARPLPSAQTRYSMSQLGMLNDLPMALLERRGVSRTYFAIH